MAARRRVIRRARRGGGRRVECRQNPGHECRDDAQTGGEAERDVVDVHVAKLRERVGIDASQDSGGGARHEQSAGDATAGEQGRLGQALQNQAAARGAERLSKSDLTGARQVAREEEVQQVRAGNDEHDGDGGPQQEQSASRQPQWLQHVREFA